MKLLRVTVGFHAIFGNTPRQCVTIEFQGRPVESQ
jgi:hypothetical protein